VAAKRKDNMPKHHQVKTLRVFDTQREQWIDLDAKPSAAMTMLHKLEGSVVPLPAPTRQDLARHLEMVERNTRSIKSIPERRQIIGDTKRAIDDVSDDYRLGGDNLAAKARELRAKRHSLSQIAETLALPERQVRELLRSAA
jgi:hypothetical protein